MTTTAEHDDLSPIQSDFEEFFWSGQRRFRCNQTWESGAPCEYDHYDLADVRRHAAAPHTRTGKTKGGARITRSVSPLVDENGSAIVHEQEVPDDFGEFKFRE